MKTLGNSVLTAIGIAGMVLLIGAAFVCGVLVTAALVILGAVLCAVGGALAKRQYESVPETYVNPFQWERQRQEDAVAPSLDRGKSRRSKLYAVSSWNRPGDQPVDHSRAATFVMPSVPIEHQTGVREYMHAGLALGQAMNALLRNDQNNTMRINPGTVRRFAQAEQAYAQLGYRTISVVEFRALANDSQTASEQAGVRLNEGEQSHLHAAGVQAAHVDAHRKRSA